MSSEIEENSPHPKYVEKKIASASMRKAQKLLDGYEEEKEQNRNWALFVAIVFMVVVLSLVLGEMI